MLDEMIPTAAGDSTKDTPEQPSDVAQKHGDGQPHVEGMERSKPHRRSKKLRPEAQTEAGPAAEESEERDKHEKAAAKKAAPVLPWMQLPISIEAGQGVPLAQVRGLDLQAAGRPSEQVPPLAHHCFALSP